MDDAAEGLFPVNGGAAHLERPSGGSFLLSSELPASLSFPSGREALLASSFNSPILTAY